MDSILILKLSNTHTLSSSHGTVILKVPCNIIRRHWEMLIEYNVKPSTARLDVKGNYVVYEGKCPQKEKVGVNG